MNFDDKALSLAAKEVAELINNSLPNEYEHNFSDEFKKKIKRLEFKANHIVFIKFTKLVASIFIVILVGFTGIVSFVPQVRAEVIHWFKSWTDTSYTYEGETSSDVSKIKFYFTPKWIPKGYRLTNKMGDTTYLYENEDKEVLSFDVITSGELSVIDTDTKPKSITVNGMKADLYTSDDVNVLVMIDEKSEYVLSIQGKLTENEIKRFAENIERTFEIFFDN